MGYDLRQKKIEKEKVKTFIFFFLTDCKYSVNNCPMVSLSHIESLLIGYLLGHDVLYSQTVSQISLSLFALSLSGICDRNVKCNRVNVSRVDSLL